MDAKTLLRLNNAIEVEELIELLQELADEAPRAVVLFAYDYGDYWHTRVAQPVKVVTADFAEYSDYHNMPKVCKDEESEKNSKATKVILLS